jgi:putative transposase
LRRAYRYLDLSRSSSLYRPKARRDYELQLVDRIKQLSQENPTYGYSFITELLARNGWRVNRKKVQRIRRAEGLIGHQTKKKSRRRGSSTAEPRSATGPNDVWSWDFIFDTTEDGQTIKIVSIVDEFSRCCIDLNVNRKISSSKVLEALDLAWERFSPPKCIRSDNGPEFVATAVQDWVKLRQIDCIYVAPGSPWENGYVESFHSRFRNDCLNREWFINELDAKVAIGDWREHYNERRPHRGIDYQSPAEILSGKCSVSSRATPSLRQSTCQTHPEPLTKT